MTIDRTLVARTFAELGSKRETAKRLGIHENSVVQILRGLADRCTRCGGATEVGNSHCADCRTWGRQRMKRRRAERLRAGLCQECDTQRSSLSLLYCDAHRERAAERRAAHLAKKRKMNSQMTARSGEHPRRSRNIRRAYGPEAAALFDGHNGCCEVCAAPHGETSIQIHHLDEDRSHNQRENLAVLCFDCHQAVHKLHALRDHLALLSWYERRYSQKPSFQNVV